MAAAKKRSKANAPAGNPNAKNRKSARTRRVLIAHEAEIRLIRFGGKKRVIRIRPFYTQKTDARREFLQQKIFHALFPENSITPVGIAAVREHGKANWGLVSEILRGRSNDYKVFQQNFYGKFEKEFRGNPKDYALTQAQEAAVRRHRKFASTTGSTLAERIQEETGIHPDLASVNICNVNGKPVFFEPRIKDVYKLKEYLENNVKNTKKKKQVLKYLEEW